MGERFRDVFDLSNDEHLGYIWYLVNNGTLPPEFASTGCSFDSEDLQAIMFLITKCYIRNRFAPVSVEFNINATEDKTIGSVEDFQLQAESKEESEKIEDEK